MKWSGEMAESVLGGMSNCGVCKAWEAIISPWSLPGHAGGAAGPVTGTAHGGNAEQEERVQGTAKN